MQEKTLDELAISYKENGSERVFAEMLRRLRPLINKRAGGAIRGRVSPEDIDQAAALAVLTALLRFDPDKGSFAAYAVAFVLAELRREAGLSVVTTEGDAKTRYIQNNAPRFIEKYRLWKNSERPGIQEFSRVYGVSEGDIVNALAQRSASSEYHETQHAADASEPSMTRQQRDVLFDAMETLSPSERSVIANRYLRQEPATVYEAGAAAGIDYKNVSRTAKTAMRKMAAALSEKGLSGPELFA